MSQRIDFRDNYIENQRNLPMDGENIGEDERKFQKSLEIFDFTTPLPEKKSGVIRLFYNNCNGLEINNTVGTFLQQKKDKIKYNYVLDTEAPTKVDSIVRQMKLWEVDVVSLSETCVAWENKVPRRVIQQITTKYDRNSCWNMASSQINIGGYVKPGGAGILLLGSTTGTIIDRGADPWKMGRWTYTLLKGTSDLTLLLITGYRTGNRTSRCGDKTAWSQQMTMLLKEGRSQKPHDAFIQDLRKWIRQYRKPGMEIMLNLDANEQWSDTSEIFKFARDLNLRSINEEYKISATHPNIANIDRSTTIDYWLCSSNVLEYIEYASSSPFDLETLGDHRGILVDLNIGSLLGAPPSVSETVQRKLTMSSPQAVQKYLKLVEESFKKQNIFQRCTKLIRRVNEGHTDVANIMRKYEAIDKEVLGICRKAERNCKPTWAGRYEWSPKLATAIKNLRYWHYRLKHGSETILIKKMGIDLQIKYEILSPAELKNRIERSRAELAEVTTNARKYRQDHLEQVAEQYASQNNLTQQQAVLELLSHEQSKETFNILKRRINPTSRSQLKTLWTSVDENGNFSKDMETKKVYTKKTEPILWWFEAVLGVPGDGQGKS